MVQGSIPNCTGYWDDEKIDAAKATYWNVTNKYYLPVRYIDSCSFANTYCQYIGGDMVSIHSYAENALVTQVAETYNTNAYIGFYRNPPSSNPWGGVWTDGTALNFVYWRGAQPDNYLGVEVCVNIFSSWSTDCSGLGGSYYSRRGLWNDVNPNGGICGVYAAVCEFKCTTAQFPIDD
uniref:C-type lectin domain-containing protein n=1 Tax=Acrobeloides nanus TaxID=290746 RepID=A0A914CVJ3_9BILA